MIVPDRPDFARARDRLTERGIPWRAVRYWYEDELVSSVGPRGELIPLAVTTALTRLGGVGARPGFQPGGAFDARDAFALRWDAHEPVQLDGGPLVSAGDLVPPSWLPFLPHHQFNRAQAEAAPIIVGTDGHVVVAAPTGAGKTAIGMLAVLRTVLESGRRAMWLVPQRSLADELDRELESWRRRGVNVERLSGEYAVDVDRLHEADLIVATTEKAEVLCRASSMQSILAEVGCVVVDEIHLLGSGQRGPLLEAFLARIRGQEAAVRVVGLSATVSNAEEIADWLSATLVRTTWRPSRLTWQLPMLPATTDPRTAGELRDRVVVELAREITNDGGSVIVFCGTKRTVRRTALAIAASRGVAVGGVNPDHAAGIYQASAAAGVGIHYKDWDHKNEAEKKFRDRDWDVLVATTTVAAGVNLPARAVVIRDTHVGQNEVDIATVLQMGGRAGRIGAGEREGWAFLITSEHERHAWQHALVEGYTVRSQIKDSLADHVLADVLQGRITTLEDATAWWRGTLCKHQGDHDTQPVLDAVNFLLRAGYLRAERRDDQENGLAVTELGRLTARLMVGTVIGADISTRLRLLPVPENPDAAEEQVISAIAELVPELANAPVAEQDRPAVATILKAGGRRDYITSTTAVTGLGSARYSAPGDVARAALLLVARSPDLFTGRRRAVAGLPVGSLYPLFEQAPRYLLWLAAQGFLATTHPWVAIVAADLGRRVRWRQCGPRRGAGRLLWMCEQMATPLHAPTLVPRMWDRAVRGDVSDPDWPHATPPALCQLDPAAYLGLLRDRATSTVLAADPETATVDQLTAGTLVTWTGNRVASTAVAGRTTAEYPGLEDAQPGDMTGAAVFTRRGDYHATDWLAAYHTAHLPTPA
ncbi:DEAD/DEAH box helicase [Kibdelosporangium phytohabitans]|uniref:DEAD/DEAH box helicase n=1 Tax=Kibdelosporangium phytohabitans TaxID=860235 RepID=A0A0N9IHU8_9PSEU|nr:DEAD/DEAH box helicase [Kibdelosporangium phytohabitans]ALG14550.1 hypothetical protein AOZ06_04675 [Kibdelosporangium phytohabitans]MBE1467432.1 helicase [Kibdelosporangium phytohabitans]